MSFKVNDIKISDDPMLGKTGVYKITNTTNGKVYYGSASETFSGRWKDHIKDLKGGRHHNKHLQHAWYKYGPDVLEFSILLICQPDLCVYYEQFYIDMCFDEGSYCYNADPEAQNILGSHRSIATSIKISQALKGKKLSEEHKQALSIAKKGKYVGEDNPSYGRKLTEEEKEHLRQLNLGKKLTEEHKKKLIEANTGENHYLYGKHMPPETKKKLSQSKIMFGIEQVNEIRMEYEGGQYTQQQLADKYNTNTSTIRNVIHGRRGYEF